MPFPDERWATALASELNSDDAFRCSSLNWTWVVALRISDATKSPEKAGVILDIRNGRCVSAKPCNWESASKAPYKLTAPLGVWMEIMTGKLDPYLAILRGKVNVRGDLPRISRFMDAAYMILMATVRVGP
jgi:putative sterol carrier protein